MLHVRAVSLPLGLSALIATLALLAACAGEAPQLPSLPSTPDGLLTDTFAPEADGGVGLPDADGSGPPADQGAPQPDGAACPVIPTKTYTGALAGQATGTITFTVVQGASGLTFSKGAFSITSPKSETFPLVLADIVCDKLHAAIARPAGSTGGTDLRGSIVGRFKPGNQLFSGSWTMPFGSGTYKAKLKP